MVGVVWLKFVVMSWHYCTEQSKVVVFQLFFFVVRRNVLFCLEYYLGLDVELKLHLIQTEKCLG